MNINGIEMKHLDDRFIAKSEIREKPVFIEIIINSEKSAYAMAGRELNEFGGVESHFCIDFFSESANSRSELALLAAKHALQKYDAAIAEIEIALKSEALKLKLYEEIKPLFSEFCENFFGDICTDLEAIYSRALGALRSHSGNPNHSDMSEMLSDLQKKKLMHLALQAASFIYEDAIS